jgi:Putative Ig domain
MAPWVNAASSSASAVTSLSVTVPSTTAGNTMAVGVYAAGINGQATMTAALGTSSSGGTSMTAVPNAVTGSPPGFANIEWFYISGIAAAQTHVNVSVSAPSGGADVAVFCYELLGAYTLDQESAHTTTTGTSWTSNATPTLTGTTDLALGVYGQTNSTGSFATITPPGAYTNVAQQNMSTLFNSAISGAEQLSASTGVTYAGTTTVSASEMLSAVIALVLPTLTVTTSSLPGGTTGTAYSQTVAATGGTGTGYTWSLNSGSLPAGLSLSSGGVISGTPQTAGTSSFVVKVTDAGSNTALSGSLSITVTSNLTVTTSGAMAGGNVGVAYSQPLAATGGYGAYTWALNSGSLPGGLSISGSNIVGTPTTTGLSTFTVKVTDAGTNTALSGSLTITISTGPVLNIVNQWPFADNGGYAPAPLTIGNTDGNGLVAIVAAGSDNVSGFCPRVAVSDDAHNWWTLAGSQTLSTAGVARRLDVWVCPNARAATAASVTTGLIYAGISGTILEISGMPAFLSVDFTGHDSVVTGTATTLSGTATGSDQVLSALALFGSNGPQTVTYPASLPTTLTPVTTSAAATDMSDVQLYTALNQSPVSAGAVSAAWSWGHSANILGLVLGFSFAPPLPMQPSPFYPGMQVESAFGFSPNAESGANPAWTDITVSRCLDDSGHTTLGSVRGRDYELTQPEAGEHAILLNNQDGALNPDNTGSAFYPNVLPEVPVRSSLWWNGRHYGVGFSYATSWPQTYPAAQWGFVPFTGKDAIGIISQGSMPSALGGEVLADLASTYYTLSEYYEAPNGAQFSNSSRFNQTPMIGWSPSLLGADYQLVTGETLGLLGDSSSGIGVGGIQSTDPAVRAMGGAFVHDNSLPQFWGTSNSVAYEFWTAGVTAGIVTSDSPPLLTGWGTPWNYTSGTNVTPGQVFAVYSSPVSGGNVGWTLAIGSRAVTASGSPGINTVAVLTRSGNWTVPVNTTSVLVECFGAGSGGDGGSGTTGGDAGSGGAYASSTLTVTPGASIPYSCASGGPGGKAGYHGSSAAGDTSWNSGQVIAKSATVAAGGISTPGQGSASTGTTTNTGGTGGTASGTGGAGGGAPASGAATGGNGASPTGSGGGNGGTTPNGVGSGGRGGNNGAVGIGGPGFSSGGGGGGKGRDGGGGSQGVIRVTYAPTVTSNSSIVSYASNSSPSAPVYHVVVTCTPSGGNFIFTLWVNGIVVCNSTVPSPSVNLLVTALAVGGVPMQGGSTLANNYVVGQVAAYPLALSQQRILSHYNVGLNARQNPAGDTTSQRVSALFQWSGINVPYGVALSDSMTPSAIGNADQVQGGALADSLYSLTLDEGGMVYAPATANGEVWYVPRQALYNKLPVAVLGDNPTDVTNGNPGFNGLAGWSLSSLSGTTAADTTVPGGRSATFTVNASVSQAQSRYASQVSPTQSYALYGYIKDITGGSEQYQVSADFYQANGSFISTLASGLVTLTAGAWQLFKLVIPSASIPSNAATVQFGPSIGNSPAINTQFQAGQFWLTCTSTEIPYDAGSGFDYSDTYVYNIVQSQRTISTGSAYSIDPSSGQAEQQTYSSLGVNATVADLTSEMQYFPRGPLQQPIETASDQDAYDRANWTLASYRQPQLRANEVSIDLASNPGLIEQVMRLEQGSIVTVNRRAIGAPVISLNCMIQKVEVHAGPDLLTVIFTLSPYFPGNAVLQLDGATNATLGATALPW